MENEKDGQDGKSCCAKGKCCGGKALVAVALLAVGGLGGYFAGKCCALKHSAPAAVEQPAK